MPIPPIKKTYFFLLNTIDLYFSLINLIYNKPKQKGYIMNTHIILMALIDAKSMLQLKLEEYPGDSFWLERLHNTEKAIAELSK